MDGSLCKVETGIFGDERDQPNPGSQSYRGAKRDADENLIWAFGPQYFWEMDSQLCERIIFWRIVRKIEKKFLRLMSTLVY